MSRVLTFSRTYPAYHPKAGQLTHFVEKIYKSILKPSDHVPITGIETTLSLFALTDCDPKHHTIRAGHRWKAGDWFSPRVWSGAPYRSKQIIIAPDIQVKKIWDVELDGDGCFWIFSNVERGPEILCEVAKNDGLTKEDMIAWFPESFTGQIICWNEKINY